MLKQIFLKLIIINLFFTHLIFSQNFQIKGKVTDKKDGEPLIGVNILIKELNRYTTTNNSGNFIFNNMSKGKYSLTFSMIGHKSLLKDIEVFSNQDIQIEMEETTINLSEVVVTGNPLLSDPKSISQASISISNFDLDIKRSTTIAQILNFQPGISMRSNGIAASRPVIRGFTNNMVLVLEDGLRMGDLSSSSDDHSVSMDGSETEKIEVLRGPSSLIYGSNAIGGVVNIITDAIPLTIPQGLNGNILTEEASTNEQYSGNAHLNYGINNFSFHSNYFRREGKNYKYGGGNEVPNSDLLNEGFQSGLSFHPTWGIVGLSYANYKSEYGIPNAPDDDEQVYLDMKNDQFKFLLNVNKISSFINSMNLKAGYLDYDHSEILRTTGKIGTSFAMKTFNSDLSLQHKSITKNSKGILGFYFLNQNYDVQGEEALTPDANYLNFAFYFLEQFQLNKFNLNIGARYEYNSIDFSTTKISDTLISGDNKTYNIFSASLGFVYNLTPRTSLFTNIANAFRSPTIEELSSYAVHEAQASFDIGNKDLDVENTIGFDFGIRSLSEKFYFELNGYYNFINNYIYRRPTDLFYDDAIGFNYSNGLQVFQYFQADAEIYGVESKINFEIYDGFSSTLIFDYVRGKNKDIDENLPKIPPMRFAIELKYYNHNYWVGLNWNLANEQKDIAQNETSTKGYGIINLYTGMRLITGNFVHNFILKFDNVFDLKYKDHLSALKNFTYMSGRNISLSYKFIF
ncbi:MAG: TonB-dependent receptor [Ignavibacterium sp.]